MQEIYNLISYWRLNKVVLAEKMGMPVSTFKNKLYPTQKQYSFTEQEKKKLIEVLQSLRTDIELLDGLHQ